MQESVKGVSEQNRKIRVSRARYAKKIVRLYVNFSGPVYVFTVINTYFPPPTVSRARRTRSIFSRTCIFLP